MQKREKWIDIAKGISILLVIIGHVSGGLTGIWNFRFVFGIHLTMFLLLSGFTLKKRPLSHEYINAKFARLMVPYFLTCLAVTLTDVFNSWFLKHDPTIKTITKIIGTDIARSFFASGSITSFGSIEFGTRIGAIWFLPSLFLALILFQLLLKATENDNLLGFLSVAAAVIGYLSARFIWLPFSIQSGLFALPFLWLGYVIKKHSVLLKLNARHFILAQIVFLYGVFRGCCYIGFVTAYANDTVISVVIGLSGCLLIYFVSTVLCRRAVILEYLGKHSLMVLCTHLYSRETLRAYFDILLNKTGLTGNAREWLNISLEIIFACGAAFCLDLITRFLRRPHEQLLRRLAPHRHRDVSVDIIRGILICSMLVGHFSIDDYLRRIIYSCHMVAFVILSGYYYREERSWQNTLRHCSKTFLIPYAAYVVSDLILNRLPATPSDLPRLIIHYAIGMSFSNKIFDTIPSVGPVYFILILFLIRVIYAVLAGQIKGQTRLSVAVLSLSVLGLALGQYGWWLPWSFDVACYCLVFYHIGRLFREKDIITCLGAYHILYFPLAAVWAYMIHAGSMEIAIRNYGDYGITLIGAVSGTSLLYMLSGYIRDNLPLLRILFSVLGKSTVIILIVHRVLSGHIKVLVGRWLNPASIFFLIACILLQLAISLIIQKMLSLATEKKTV